MKQEDVDLIYDYLHENYEYVDGELISVKSMQGRDPGSRLGSLKVDKKGKSYYVSGLQIGGHRKYLRLSHLIWIYHHKEKTRFVAHLNGNIVDNRIENIAGHKTRVCFQNPQQYIKPRRGCVKNKSIKNGIAFEVRIESQSRRIGIGRYDNEALAQEVFNYARSLLPIYQSNAELKKIVREKYPVYVDNATGFTGVQKVGERFRARYLQKGFGIFDTPEEAHKAYLKAKEDHATT